MKSSKIEWTDHTVNLWWGCSKVHNGCKNCYAETLSSRFGDSVWGEKQPRKRIKSAFNDLAKFQAQAKKEGVKKRVFVGSMMDIFEDSKPLINPIPGYDTTEDLRWWLFSDIKENRYPNLIFLFLTKRPENIDKYLPDALRHMDNLWFGTSISNSDTARYGKTLVQQSVKNRFLSIEPQVGGIWHEDLYPLIDSIGWIIQGGESGPGRRHFDINWAYWMKDFCAVYATPYFFKQIDKVKEIPDDLMIRELPFKEQT